jgi:dihydrodiol dehydrogenase / D-xylose 1-dehydrogenase (NADP)
MESYWSRHFPSWKALRDDLHKIGKLHLIEANFCNANLAHHHSSYDNDGSDMLFTRGAYTIMFVLWITNGQMPSGIYASGAPNERDTNKWGNVVLEFPSGLIANIFYSGAFNNSSPATVTGEFGNISMKRFWSATEIIETLESPFEVAVENVKEFSIKGESFGFAFPYGGAFYLMADHVHDCITSGKLESEIMPLEESLKMTKILDKIRRQLGLRLPQDS